MADLAEGDRNKPRLTASPRCYWHGRGTSAPAVDGAGSRDDPTVLVDVENVEEGNRF